jgi:tetratricopeptide (TPR) repeat protein
MKKILFILLFLSGCSSKPIHPIPAPSYERLSAIKGQISEGSRDIKAVNLSEEAAKDYLNAMKAESLGNTKEACKLFSDLSDNRDFPLNQTALVHTLNNCTFSERQLKSIWKETIIANYLKESYYESSLKYAEKLKMDEFIAYFSFELVTYKALQAEKVELLKNAIAIAQKLELQDDEVKYFQKLVEVSPLYSKEVNRDNMYSVARDYETKLAACILILSIMKISLLMKKLKVIILIACLLKLPAT